MKNNKGFTLVELLAVIVILAIIVGITLVTILPTISNSREKAFHTSLDVMERWVTQQYEMMSFDPSYTETDVSKDFINICGPTGNLCLYSSSNELLNGVILNTMEDDEYTKEQSRKFINSAGLKPSNYSMLLIAIDKNSARVCIKATMSTNGEYYFSSAINEEKNYYQSKSCNIEIFKPIPNITTSFAYEE